MGAKFQYDEEGSSFFYFLLSFEALIVIPCTYYFYPKSTSKKEQKRDKNACHCDQCRVKHSRLRAHEPWKKAKERFIKMVLLIGWIAVLLTAYKVTNLKHDYVAYNPYEILQIDQAASMAEIKKAYRKLSLVYHPDKETGDERQFMMIAKAYAALTDEEARKNFDIYGDPDGPGAMSFGIALPSWLVDSQNSIWVLGLYALVFMVALPLAVGIWWYRSIKFGGDQVLLDTTQIYLFYIYKTPHMIFKRVLMILGASMEYKRSSNSEIIERPSDNVEVNMLIKELSNLGEKNKEKPLCFSYSIKARALLHSHLSRLPLPSKHLEEDRLYVVKKAPLLIQEFIQCASQLTMLALAGKVPRMPSLDTLENAMRLCPCIVQAMWDNKNPLLQLPHITEDQLRHFTNRKRNIRSIKHLAMMKGDDRRAMLRNLNEDEYDNVMNVLARMPIVDFEVKSEVLDDEDSCTITAGAIVTVTATLYRKPMCTLFNIEQPNQTLNVNAANEYQTQPSTSQAAADQSPKVTWEKSKKKKSKGGKLKKGVTSKVTIKPKANSQTTAAAAAPVKNGVLKNAPKEEPKKQKRAEVDSDSDVSVSSDSEAAAAAPPTNTQDDGEDDDEWEKFQEKVLKKEKKVLETKSKKSHTVHCPHFTEEKEEYWWIYLADKKRHALTSVPYLVTNLVNVEEVELKFHAPSKPGIYTYSVIMRSDSYIDFDVIKNIKLDVKEAKEIDLTKVQWDISEEEEEKDEEESAVEDSDLEDSDLEDD